MSGVQDQLEIKFRLIDGSDIGPNSYPASASFVNLKESILSQWPNKERENGPRTVKDVKLISAGRILENNRTVGECRSPLCDVPGGVTTMHVVVQPPPLEKEKKAPSDQKENKCLCYIIKCSCKNSKHYAGYTILEAGIEYLSWLIVAQRH